jgi:hypothetical protein
MTDAGRSHFEVQTKGILDCSVLLLKKEGDRGFQTKSMEAKN